MFVRFLKRLAQWILLPVFVLSASIGVVAVGWNYYQEYRDRGLAIAKTWPPTELLFGGRAILKTSWRRDMLYYQFSVTPITEDFLQRFRSRKDSHSHEGNFSLDLEDGAGFKLGGFEINLGKMTRIVNEKGEVVSVEIKDSTWFARDAYRNTSRVVVLWPAIFEEVAREIETEKTNPKVTAVTKRGKTPSAGEPSFFTTGSSKDEVLRVQGQPTTIGQYTWWYGSA